MGHDHRKPLEIWFQDEARVGQKGSLTRIWAPRGTRPRAIRDHRHDWAYLFGAVCPARAEAAALVLPHADSEAMSLHLSVISAAIASNAHAVVVTDGAGYHHKAAITIPDNITLITLPPYSPELNPIENVWQYLRQNFLAHRIFDDYDQIVEACASAWNALVATPERLRTITSREWAKAVNT